MARQREQQEIRDQVQQGLSETRTTVLGGQILMGFQYEAMFQSGFPKLSPLGQELQLWGFILILAAIVLMIAPASFHQLSERGESTEGQRAALRALIPISLAPFTVGVGLNVLIGPGMAIGWAPAGLAAVVVVLGAVFLWYGMELIAMRSRADPPGGELPRQAPPDTSLKDEIKDLMTETRIVLPGAQALLGFQFIGYLTEGYAHLSTPGRIGHGVALAALIVSMVLLMTPAPFHRLAENGQETERLRRLTVRMILGALAALAAAFAADLFVAIEIVTGQTGLALGGALAAAVAIAAIWFVWPLSRRGRSGVAGHALGHGRSA
ncbi:MAG: hypothetical protein JO111_06735 [Caulobacteraceae bacterium]|nr:hypothetical protein [Caulobacteraceae bacterium]